MGMISSRQSVLSRTSGTVGQSNRSWGSKAIRTGQSLEDFRAGNPELGFPQKFLRGVTAIFEGDFCRKPRKKQIQTRIATATSEGLRGIIKSDPQAVRPVLEMLRSDSESYVKKSVANLLRNASSKHPEFVL